MSSNTPRDMQFRGFAKLLMDKLKAFEATYTDGGGFNQDENSDRELIIAQAAYDLAFHVIDNSRSNDMEDWYAEQIIPYVPDMTELPKEEDE